MAEKNDGYQHVHMRRSADNAEFASQQIEHGSGYKATSAWWHTVVKTVDIENLSDSGSFKLYWRGHGEGDDNWYLKNRSVTIEAVK